jgi:pyruvate/2-oxoglutarate dehydrogenase complex dihydrolipoamide acyltransferase (E2) component
MKPFPSDGHDFEPGQPVPDVALPGASRSWMLGQGYIQEIPDDLLTDEQREFLENYDSERTDATPAAEEEAQQQGVDLESVEGSGEGGRVTVQDVREEAIAQEEHDAKVEKDLEKASSGEIKATDAAIKLAEQQSVPLGDVNATGSGGQITKTDVQNYLDAGTSSASAEPSGGQEGVQTSEESGGTTVVPGHRGTGASNRMSDSVQTDEERGATTPPGDVREAADDPELQNEADMNRSDSEQSQEESGGTTPPNTPPAT